MRDDLASSLAAGFLAGDWTQAGLRRAGLTVVGRRMPWMTALVREVLATHPTAPADRPRELAAHVARTVAAARAGSTRPVVHPVLTTRVLANPWHLPVLDDLSDVRALLGLTQGDLDWFSDPRRLARETGVPALQHYRVTSLRSASGGVRVLEAPKPRLKALQRRLLDAVVSCVPVHDAAHGFVPGRSVASYAAPHSGRPVVLRMDLEGFFASVTVGRVYGTFRTAGLPEPVAHALAGLATTVLPRHTWQALPRPDDPRLLEAHWRLGRRLAAPHLPQGAPTSPALANLAAHRLDRRLSALASSWGGCYTRYADDLALSGRWHGAATTRLIDLFTQVAVEEGFRVNERKTAVMSHAGRQVLTGLVVNDRPRVARRDVDALKALLHNCARHGPSTQDRRGTQDRLGTHDRLGTQDRLGHRDFHAHLVGRIGWVAQHDPARGARLRAQLDAVDWTR